MLINFNRACIPLNIMNMVNVILNNSQVYMTCTTCRSYLERVLPLKGPHVNMVNVILNNSIGLWGHLERVLPLKDPHVIMVSVILNMY